MSDSKHSMNAVPALLDERRRYEAWLGALEARRDSTPAHVFDRVHADYTTRLRRVEEQLSSHHQSIQDERVSVQSRLALLEAEERMRLDERAELELRMQVGELTGPDAISAAGAVDDAIHQYATERAHLVRQLSELDALLAQRAAEARTAAAARVQAPVAAAPPLAAPPVTAPAAAQPTPLPTPVPPRPAARPSAAIAAPPLPVSPLPGPPTAPAAPSPRPSQSMPQAVPASGSFDELAFLSTVVGAETPGQGAHAPTEPTVPQANAAPAATATPPDPAASAPAPIVQPMARLKPLTAQPRPPETPLPAAPPPPRPSAGIIRDDAAAKSLLDGIGGSRLGGERPLAANDPANTPIVLRTSGSTEQSKTLRCAECGAMNYPTEWYCERCGAELAAL